MKKNVIYRLTAPNGKSYIGLTTDIDNRMNVHKRSAIDGKLQRAIKKYGWNSFEKEILLEVNNSALLAQLEIFCIKLFDSFENGYNSTPGGERGMAGHKVSDETRKRMSFAKLGKKRTPLTNKTKQKISVALKGKNKGRKLPPRTTEHKLKISKSMKAYRASKRKEIL
jgi:group I intron endonuclease